MDDGAVPCGDCGASGRFGGCDDLFRTLLARDHERLPPWGRFHALNVSCFLLQHPSHAPGGATGTPWALVTAFLTGGLDAVNRLTGASVRANRHGHPLALGPPTAPPRSVPPSYTIEDLSVDGSFPADGYADRMRTWAASVAAERTAPS